MTGRKPAAAQHAFGLKETAQASKGGDKAQGHTLTDSGPYMGERPDAGGDLHDPQEESLRGGRDSGDLSDHLRQDGEEHQIPSYFDHHFKGVHQSLIKGGGRLAADRREGDFLSLKAVEPPCDQGDGKDGKIDGRQDHGHGDGRVGHGSHISQEEHGAWMVADSQEESAFKRADPALLHKLTAGLGPHGVAAEETGGQHITAGIGQAKEAF